MAETDLSDDQMQAAIDHGCALAMEDDDRSGDVFHGRYALNAKQWKRTSAKKGPRFVNMMEDE